MRIGHGYDVHRFAENRRLVIGGVEIPFEMGLLGAAALWDIGKHFPDTDPAFCNIDSRILLRKTAELLRERGFVPVNIDATVIAQKPKLAAFIPEMVKNIAADCGIDPDCVNVKATTEEGLGFTGKMEGISAHAVCLIERI